MPTNIALIEEALEGDREPHTIEELQAMPDIAALRLTTKVIRSAIYNASRNTDRWEKLEDGYYVFYGTEPAEPEAAENGSVVAPSPEAEELWTIRKPLYSLFGTDVAGHDILRGEDGALFVAVPVAEHAH